MSGKIEISRELAERMAKAARSIGLSIANEIYQAIDAAPVVERQPVAYLDIGAGGYLDLGSDLTNEQLQALPNGRHILGILGTYGIDGWEPALTFPTSNLDPVAYATFDDGGKVKIWSKSAKVVEDIARHGEKAIALYTSPPAPVAVQLDENVEFEKWWCRTPVLRKSRIQVAQEAWEARARLDKVKELNQ